MVLGLKQVKLMIWGGEGKRAGKRAGKREEGASVSAERRGEGDHK